MAKRPDEATITLRLHNVISAATDGMFEQFDLLHKQEIHDNDVIGFLRAEGLHDLAKRYIDWGGCIDPDEDNTTTSPAVPDPGDAPSYKAQEEIREDADLTGTWTNGLATIELTGRHTDRSLIGCVWEAIQPDAVFGNRRIVITPAGLRDAGYRRVQA